jgi:hypothetical protein
LLFECNVLYGYAPTDVARARATLARCGDYAVVHFVRDPFAVGRCALNQDDPSPMTYGLSNP